MSMRSALAAALIILASPSLANDDPQPQAATEVSATGEIDKKAAEERKVCKRIQSTESRLGAKKVCMTKAQWREYEAS
jgi:hypothetical protein